MVVAALALAACGGGDDGPSAEEEVRAAATRMLTNNSTEADCRDFSSGLIAETYGSVPRCLEVAKEDEEEEEDDDLELTGVVLAEPKVNGDRATVQVRSLQAEQYKLRGGGVELVRQDGRWRLDQLRPDFVRGALIDVFIVGFTDEKELRSIVTPEVRRCVRDVPLPDDAEAQREAYEFIGERRQNPDEGLFPRVGVCMTKTRAARAALRTFVEKELISSVDDVPDSIDRCAVARLRRTVTSRALAELTFQLPGLSDEQIGSLPAMQRVRDAFVACAPAARPDEQFRVD